MANRDDTVTGRLAADPVAAEVWRQRYRAPGERGVEQTRSRVASTLASAVGGDVAGSLRVFRATLDDFRFLPGGRILPSSGIEPVFAAACRRRLRHADGSVSKPEGCTVFPPNAVGAAVLYEESGCSAGADCEPV